MPGCAACLDDLERAVAGRVAALEAQSPAEIELIERALSEAAELLGAIQEQARAFSLARTSGTERKQASAFDLKKAG